VPGTRNLHWQSEREERISSRRDLEQRARVAWGEWFEERIRPTVFGTLTFRPPFKGTNQRVGDVGAERAYGRFLQLASELLRCQVVGVAVNEHTKAGLPHGHVLLRLSRPHKKGDGHLLELAWRKAHRKAGYTRFEKPRVQRRTGKYCGKYLAKETSRGEGVVFSEEGWS